MLALLTLELFFPEAQSLKDKRSLCRPLLERLRRDWNVSAAEVDHQDVWQRATVAVAAVNTERAHAERILREVLAHAESRPGLEVVESSLEFR